MKQSRAALLYAAALAALFITSWLRWPDAWIDFGHFLYNAWRLSDGARLGTDLTYFYGPVPIVLWGRLFAWIGPSIALVYAVNFLLLIADVWLLHRIFSRISLSTAVANTLLFLCVFALGQYIVQGNYNYLAPYKPEATFGISLLLLQIELCLGATTARSAAAGALLTLSIFVATETLLGALAIAFVALVTPPKGFSREAFVMAAAGSFAALSGALLALLPAQAVFRAVGVLGNTALVRDPVYRELMGVDEPLAHLAGIALAFGALCLAAFAAAGAAKRVKNQRAVTAALLLGPAAVILATGTDSAFLAQFPKVLPPLALAGLALWSRKRDFLTGAWSALSLALLARMILHPMISYYGFTLAMPATLLLVPLAGLLPVKETRPVRLLALGLAIALAVSAITARSRAFGHKNVPVSAWPDPLYDWDSGFSQGDFSAGDRGAAMHDAIADLRGRLGKEDELLVLPNGYMVNYLLRARRPVPFSFLPGDLNELGEAAMTAAVKSASPRYVLLLRTRFGEDVFGFGKKFGQELLGWIDASYTRVRGYGSDEKLLLLERKAR